jgi:hypothetical protein
VAGAPLSTGSSIHECSQNGEACQRLGGALVVELELVPGSVIKDLKVVA